MGFLFEYLYKKGNKMPIIVNNNNKKRITLPELKMIAKNINIKTYGMKKYDIAKRVERHYALLRLIIFWRSRKRRERERERRVQKKRERSESSKIINNFDAEGYIDPITLDHVEEHFFEYGVESGKRVRYSLITLVEHLCSSKQFRDPITNNEYSDEDLKAIDRAVKLSNLGLQSVFDLKYSSQSSEQKISQNLSLTFEREIGTLIGITSEIIQGNPPFQYPKRSADYFNIIMIPTLTDLLKQFYFHDKEGCEICISQSMEFLKGPPNRPTLDRFGFLNQTLSWFDIVREHIRSF